MELGKPRGDMRIITAGLQAGDHVIVKGLQRVRPGQKVDAEAAPAKIAETSLVKPVVDAMPVAAQSKIAKQER